MIIPRKESRGVRMMGIFIQSPFTARFDALANHSYIEWWVAVPCPGFNQSSSPIAPTNTKECDIPHRSKAAIPSLWHRVALTGAPARRSWRQPLFFERKEFEMKLWSMLHIFTPNSKPTTVNLAMIRSTGKLRQAHESEFSSLPSCCKAPCRPVPWSNRVPAHFKTSLLAKQNSSHESTCIPSTPKGEPSAKELWLVNQTANHQTNQC